MSKRLTRRIEASRYEPVKPLIGWAGYRECFYCGEPADTGDHVPPMSRVGDYQSLGLAVESYLVVASCRECNSLLGDSLQESIIARCEELKRRMRRKYAKVLRMPDWTASELRALGRQMRSTVKAAIFKAETIEARLDYDHSLSVFLREHKE